MSNKIIKSVLLELIFLRDNRSLIESKNRDFVNVKNSTPVSRINLDRDAKFELEGLTNKIFKLTSGSCINANVLNLDYVKIYGNLPYYLGKRFIEEYKHLHDIKHKSPYCPVPNTVDGIKYDIFSLYLNPMRWAFIDHCISELEFILRNDRTKHDQKGESSKITLPLALTTYV